MSNRVRGVLLVTTALVLVTVAGGVAFEVAASKSEGRVASRTASEFIASGAKTLAGFAVLTADAAKTASSCSEECAYDRASGVVAAVCIRTATTAASGMCRASGGKRTAVPALVAEGVLTGDFDPAMSDVCQGACAAPLDVPAAGVAAQPSVRVGSFTQCPVSGVVFEVAKDNPSYPLGDEVVYTCCGACLGRLKAQPERFLNLKGI